MTKRTLWTLIGSGIFIVLSAAAIYWFYFSKPTAFPEKAQVLQEMNSVFPGAAASVIQDIIPVDERHVVVPFISKEEEYSLSYWVWKNHKWRVASIDKKGGPRLWKVDENNPSTYQFVWNIHPADQLSSIHFYLIRDRGYQITDGVGHYYPRVQMAEKVLLQETSYGLMQLPDDWVAFMNSFIKVESSKEPGMFLNSFFPETHLSFGWIPYGPTGKETFPERSVNGSGYSNGEIHKVQMRLLDNEDIEVSSDASDKN